MSYKITDFQLPVKFDDFCTIFWHEKEWYADFMQNKLQDINIYIGEWTEHDDKSLVRNIKSDHPSKVSFPGLPSHATSMKIQKMRINESQKTLTIIESNNFDGIPYSDYFRVDTVWNVEEIVSMFMGSAERCTQISITGEVVFLKSTWLRGSIESNTKAELQSVFSTWEEEALSHIKNRSQLSDRIPEPGVVTNVHLPPLFEDPPRISRPSSRLSIASSDEDFYDCEGEDIAGEEEGTGSGLRYGDRDAEEGIDDETYALLHDVRVRQQQMRAQQRRNFRQSEDPYASPRASRSDSYEYGVRVSGDIEMGSPRRFSPHDSPMHLLTPTQLMELYGSSRSSLGGSSASGRRVLNLDDADRLAVDGEERKPVGRVVAITVAEVLYVLAESSFWQIYNMYRYDLRDLFTVEPVEVLQRVANCFIPGRHSSLLATPDLYGPAIAVVSLPQVLLLAMDSSHHGCSRSYLLGDAVVVSLCLWMGLSIIYRLVAFLVAPTITLKHSLCLTGYSMFAWNVALLVSHALDVYDFLGIPPKYSLILFGIPTAIAQGYVFWEHTPLSLRSQQLPASMRRWADQHSRLADRLLWAVPKLLVLIIIAVTHYQFLWYIARVFLPGRKHFCRLSALMNPANYADILSQKELRQFTINVLRKGGVASKM